MTSTRTEDTIEVSVLLKASREKVWNALTTREGWSAWFSADVLGKFQPGEILQLDFGPYGQCYAVVDERRDQDVFAYRWHPGEDCSLDKYPEAEMTKVRFELSDHPEGISLKMIESGFSNLPESRRLGALSMNESGWGSELQELADWVEQGKVQDLGPERILRIRIVQASREKVWQAVATPEGFGEWFNATIEGKPAAGELWRMTFQNGVVGEFKIETYEPMTKFAFRWHPGQRNGVLWGQFPDEEATLVTITLEDDEAGILIRILETGFENVPESRRKDVQDLNAVGWTMQSDSVAKWLRGG